MRTPRGPRSRDEIIPLGTGTAIADPAPSRRRSTSPPIGPPRTAVATGGRPTRVLGLDLALGVTGFCLLVGGQPAGHGVFELPAYQRKGESLAAFLGRRADDLAERIRTLVALNRPEIVGYEYPDRARGFYAGGSKGREFHAVQGLSRAEGFLVALWPHIGDGARLVAVPMTLAKRTATGRIDANKQQVRWGLQTYRGWDLRGWDDNAVDAAAVALAAREML